MHTSTTAFFTVALTALVPFVTADTCTAKAYENIVSTGGGTSGVTVTNGAGDEIGSIDTLSCTGGSGDNTVDSSLPYTVDVVAYCADVGVSSCTIKYGDQSIDGDVQKGFSGGSCSGSFDC